MDSGVSASQKYAPEIHSVMMTGVLREKFPNLVSSCTLRPEWAWFVIKGVRSISANVVVLIDRIIVLNDRKISPRPLCNAKCQIRTRLPFILEMFTKLSSSVLTSPFYRTAPKTPSRQCNASGACGTVRALSTIPSGC